MLSAYKRNLTKIPYANFILSFFAGCLIPLCFSPFDQITNFSAYLIFLLIAFFFIQIKKANDFRTAFIQSWVFGIGLFLSGISWLYVAIHEYGSTPWWLASLFTIVFIIVLALFFAFQGGLSFILMRVLHKQTLQNNHYSIDWQVYLILFPIIWIVFEWLRSWVLTGLPWLLIGYSQISTPLAGYAPIIGVYGLSLFSVVIAGIVALLLKTEGIKKSSKALLLLCVLTLFISGHFFQKQQWTSKINQPLVVSLVQGNVSQHLRWDKNFLQRIKQRYYGLSYSLWNKTDILVWPENAIPVFYQYEEFKFFKKIKKQVDVHDISFITGVPYLNKKEGKYYNSLLRMEKNSNAFYFKQRLVPFGEYLPLENWLRGIIRFFDIPMSAFSLPPKDQKIIMIKGIPVAITLCYEDIFPRFLLEQLPQAQFLLNLSNNGWYGDSLAPHQHLQIARMRALESGRELVRSTTSGISALIDHKGNVIKQSEQFKSTILSGTVQPRTGITPFVRYGNTPLIVYVLLMICVMLYFTHKNSNNSPKSNRD